MNLMLDGNFNQLTEGLAYSLPPLRHHDKKEEPSAARAAQLAPLRARFHCQAVPVIDLAGRDRAGEFPLQPPAFVHDAAKLGDVESSVAGQTLQLICVLSHLEKEIHFAWCI